MNALEKLMKEEGVEIIKNAEVTEMLNSDNKIKGVQINNKEKNTQTIYKLNLLDISDENIQIPANILAYRTPSMKTRESRVFDMISTYLSSGQSSILYKKLVDEKKMALQVFAGNNSQEDYGIYLIGGLPLGDTKLPELTFEIDEEIEKLKSELISERDFQKIQNIFESQYVSSNSTIQGIANSLARYHVLYGDVNLINNEIDIYRSVTREEIREVAKLYLNKTQRLELKYLPKNN